MHACMNKRQKNEKKTKRIKTSGPFSVGAGLSPNHFSAQASLQRLPSGRTNGATVGPISYPSSSRLRRSQREKVPWRKQYLDPKGSDHVKGKRETHPRSCMNAPSTHHPLNSHTCTFTPSLGVVLVGCHTSPYFHTQVLAGTGAERDLRLFLPEFHVAQPPAFLNLKC